MQLKETKNYDEFKRIGSNRPVSSVHVEKLKKAILKKNLLHLNPIIVDKNKNIIDGQHRLEAAKSLKVPIFYIIDNHVNDVDIADLNTNKSNWNTNNYIDFYASKGNDHYKRLRKFLKAHPEVVMTFVIRLGTKTVADWATNAVKEGAYIFDNQEGVEEILSLASDFKDFEYRYDRDFLLALAHCVETGEYDHLTMQDKIAQQPGKLKRQPIQAKYVEHLEELYNFRNSVSQVNFRLSKKVRERQKAKLEEEVAKKLKQQLKAKQPGAGSRRRSPIEASKLLATIKASEKKEGEKTIPVKIDAKTTVWVKPGTDIKKLKQKYLEHASQMMEG